MPSDDAAQSIGIACGKGREQYERADPAQGIELQGADLRRGEPARNGVACPKQGRQAQEHERAPVDRDRPDGDDRGSAPDQAARLSHNRPAVVSPGNEETVGRARSAAFCAWASRSRAASVRACWAPERYCTGHAAPSYPKAVAACKVK